MTACWPAGHRPGTPEVTHRSWRERAYALPRHADLTRAFETWIRADDLPDLRIRSPPTAKRLSWRVHPGRETGAERPNARITADAPEFRRPAANRRSEYDAEDLLAVTTFLSGE